MQPQATQISQGERGCVCQRKAKGESVSGPEAPKDVTHALPERGGNTLSQEGVFPHVLGTVEECLQPLTAVSIPSIPAVDAVRR